MVSRRWTIRHFGDWVTLEVQPAGIIAVESARRSLAELERLLWSRTSAGPIRRALVEVHQSLYGFTAGVWHDGPPPETLKQDLFTAARIGRLVLTRTPSRLVGLPIDALDDALGPDTVVRDDFVRVLLFDSVGKPIPSDLDQLPAKVDIHVSGGPAYDGLSFAGGMADVPSVPPGFPSQCAAIFHGVAEGSEPVPGDAPPAALAVIDASLIRGTLSGPILLPRRRFSEKNKQTAWLSATTAFQLQRRTVSVVELEQFADGGALLWPRELLADSEALLDGAPFVRGIDVLREVLSMAPSYPPDHVLVTGHDASVSQERADGVLALLVGDDDARDDWVVLALGKGKVDDQQAILKWAAVEFSWPCDPGDIDGEMGPNTKAAIKNLQRAYNVDLAAGLFPSPNPDAPIEVDGTVGKHTWGAMFDCYQRALRGPSVETQGSHAYIVVDDQHQTYPYELAQIAAPGNDGNKWPDLNPLNPSMVKPDGKGWYWPQVGQKIFIPDSWTLQALLDAGYDGGPAQTPQITPAAAQALPAQGPKAIGSGDHHLSTPFAKADNRRAKERAAEVVFLDAGEEPELVCTKDSGSPCTAATCELFDPREYDFSYVPLSPAGAALIAEYRVLRIEDDSPMANAVAVVLKADGTLMEASTDGDGWLRLFGQPGDTFKLVRVDDPDKGHRLCAVEAAVSMQPSSS
jgi:peptidoglycan hydrolase-like protein with peptidoglycan-binding domain